MSYSVNSKPYPTFGFTYQGDNKTVDIEVGHDGDLFIIDVLEAVKDVLIAGGFDYVNEVRAVSYGESEHTIHSSNREASDWTEPADVLPDDDDDDLPRLMAEETIRKAGFSAGVETAVKLRPLKNFPPLPLKKFSAAKETTVNTGISSSYYEEPDEREFQD